MKIKYPNKGKIALDWARSTSFAFLAPITCKRLKFRESEP